MAKKPDQSLADMADEFYLMMGHCISNWARVEHQLFRVFRVALGAPTERAAIIYGRLNSIDLRRAYTDALLKVVLPKKDPPNGGKDHPDTKEWTEIFAEMGALISIRNRIAHQPMGPKLQLEPEYARDLWFELSSHDFDLARGKSDTPLRQEDLVKHAEDVWELKEKLATFRANTLSKHAPALF